MKQTSSAPTDWDTVRILWRAGMRNRRLLLLSLLNPVGALFNGIFVPFYISKILATLVHDGGQVSQYFIPLVLAATIGLLANRYGFASLMAFQAKTQSELQTDCLEALLRRSVGFHNNRVSGKLVSDAIDFPNAFGSLVSAVIINLLPFLTIVVGGIVLVTVHSLLLGAALLVLAGVTLGWAWIESRRRAGLRTQRLAASKLVTAHLSDTIVNAQTVKTFAREPDELERHRYLNSALEMLRVRDWQSAATRGNDRMAVLLLMQITFVAVVIHAVHNNPSVLAVGIFAFSYTITLTNRLFDVGTMIRTLEDALLQASPMTEVLLGASEITDKAGAKPLRISRGAIRLDAVSFAYPDSQPGSAVFDHFSLDVQPGEKIGLVGPSGGGKSTLTRLLLRFEDVTEGIIEIDGQAVQSVTQSSLRQAIAYVPQEPLLFHRSIRENISYGKPRAKRKAVIDAAKKAFAHDFIEHLPKGYDTLVGERGVKLSGGQRQRIAIARAILKDAPILVLDEATSALDSESEQLIQAALWELMKGRTALVIAHRLSTIQKMNRIVVLDDGRVAEQGTHKELIKAGGLYARLWGHQSGGFLEE